MTKHIIRHAYYGCESGCCGHQIVIVADDGEETYGYFDFGHPAYWDFKAKAYVRDGEREAVERQFIEDVLDGAARNGYERVAISYEDCEFSDD